LDGGSSVLEFSQRLSLKALSVSTGLVKQNQFKVTIAPTTTKPMPQKKSEVEPATTELAAKNTFRILILDDIEHVKQLKAACKNAGHSVVPAHTVKEAMAFLDGANHADVIVCAAYLEDQNIFEFLKRLRGNPLHKQSMFMILALAPGPMGVKMNATVEIAGHHLGSDAFISMPVFDAVQLIAEIKKLLPLVPWVERSRLDELEDEQKQSSDRLQQLTPSTGYYCESHAPETAERFTPKAGRVGSRTGIPFGAEEFKCHCGAEATHKVRS